MYRRIIIGHDLHGGGRDALAFGRLVADASGAALVVASVIPTGSIPTGFEISWREHQATISSTIERIASENGAEAEVLASSTPTRGLHDLATDIGADLIIVGSSRHSRAGQILAGNVGLSLLGGSPTAVAIAPHGYADPPEHRMITIVVGFDGSVESRRALEAAVALAESSQATLRLVAIAEPPPEIPAKGAPDVSYRELTTAIESRRRDELNAARDSIPSGVVAEASLIAGDPATKLAEAGAHASLLMLGSRAYGPARRVLLGSVSAPLVRKAPCPVIVEPRGDEPEPIAAAGTYAEVTS